MAHDSVPVGPARLWRELTIEERTALAAALWDDGESAQQQAEAVQLIARQMKFRPQSVLALAPEKLVRYLAGLHQVSESIANRALVVYHLSAQRPMLEAFLTRLGIAHEEGLISGTFPPPDPAALREAAAALATEFPPAAVRLYLRTLAAQDPETWSALAEIASGTGPS